MHVRRTLPLFHDCAGCHRNHPDLAEILNNLGGLAAGQSPEEALINTLGAGMKAIVAEGTGAGMGTPVSGLNLGSIASATSAPMTTASSKPGLTVEHATLSCSSSGVTHLLQSSKTDRIGIKIPSAHQSRGRHQAKSPERERNHDFAPIP